MLQTVGGLVVGLDLVKVQILIPILPHGRSHPPLPPPFHERRISPQQQQEAGITAAPAARVGCG